MILKKQISNKHGQKILDKLCDMVGVDSKTFDFDQDEWYLKHTWTRKQQNEFRGWLADFLEKHKYTSGTYRGQRHGQYEAAKLILNYGWRVVDEA